MSYSVCANYQCHTGENPIWHPLEKKVYWCDIPLGRIYRHDPVTDTHEMVFEGGEVGGFTIQEDGALLLFMDRGAIRLLDNGKLTTLRESLDGEENSRFNDVIADPEGRVYCGTMPSSDHDGSLYRLDTDGTITKLLAGIKCSNGMAFTVDLSQIYYTDSGKKQIYVFDYDRKTGELTNQRTVIDRSNMNCLPDGMTVDSNGDLWSAHWDGYGLYHFNPAGEELGKIELPAKKTSSVTFAGDDYRDMYITSAGGDDLKTNGELAGALFKVRSEVAGRPEFFSKIRVS